MKKIKDFILFPLKKLIVNHWIKSIFPQHNFFIKKMERT